MKKPPIELDAMDRRILGVLQAEGRISNLDLAERVGLSPMPCGRRVRRLEDAGVITGYGARVDPAALGLGISVMMTVRLGRQSQDDIREFLTVVDREPEITECLLVTGNLDYMLRLQVRDVEALRQFTLDKLKTIPCVAETATMLILETSKSVALSRRPRRQPFGGAAVGPSR